MSVRFAIEPLAKAHKRADFTCGNDRIDAYVRETVSQDVKRNYATCFVAREIATDRVAGFYTLSSSNVPLNEVPEPLAKKLPRHPTVPAVLIVEPNDDSILAPAPLTKNALESVE